MDIGISCAARERKEGERKKNGEHTGMGDEGREKEGKRWEEEGEREREREVEVTGEKWGVRVTPGKPKQTGLLCVGAYDARRSVACGEGRTLTLRTHRCASRTKYTGYTGWREKNLRVCCGTFAARRQAAGDGGRGRDVVIRGRKFQNMAA